jgi:hypothetical protein
MSDIHWKKGKYVINIDRSTMFRLINNKQFYSYVDHSIYPVNVKLKTPTSASYMYLDILLHIDAYGKLTTQLYDKRDDFNFPLSTFHIHVATSHYHLLVLNIFYCIIHTNGLDTSSYNLTILCIWRIFSADSICKGPLCIR